MKKKLLSLFIIGLLLLVPACSKKKEKVSIPLSLELSFQPSELMDASIVKMIYKWKPGPNFSLKGDYWVFVHFNDEKKNMYFQDDHKPPIPVEQWKPGEPVVYERTVVLPEFFDIVDREYFKVKVTIGIWDPQKGESYDVFVKEYSVKINPLAEEIPFVNYKDGWYEEESNPDGTVTWRWASKTAICEVENPKKKVKIFIKGSFNEKATPDQRVQIFVNDHLIDEIRETPFIKVYEVNPEILGNEDTFIIKLVSDKEFVPAEFFKESKDNRVLAVSINRIFVTLAE